MASKIDKDLMTDAKQEHRENFGKNPVENVNSEKTEQEKTGNSTDKKSDYSDPGNTENKTENSSSSYGSQAPKNDFKEKFEEYFKGMDGLITGEMVTGAVDDFKANLLMIYAKKSGVDLPKEAFLMDAKTKKFAAFLVDHAVKDKLFAIIEKYPLAGAAGVIGISAFSSYMMVQLLKNKSSEADKAKKENDALKAKLKKYEQAETVTDLNEKGYVKSVVE